MLRSTFSFIDVFFFPFLTHEMAAIVWWHVDRTPRLGCLGIDCVRPVEGSTLTENELCEGVYEKEWYECILLYVNKGKCNL